MRFKEIIDGLLNGKKYTTSNSSYYIYLDGEIFITNQFGTYPFDVFEYDLIRDDWEETTDANIYGE